MITRLLVVVIVLTLAPMQAWAACAWVLWQEALSSSPFVRPLSAHDAQKDCYRERDDWLASARKDGFSVTDTTVIGRNNEGQPFTIMYRCLPDTIDPRGPKGAPR
jgi:hypothetical protein